MGTQSGTLAGITQSRGTQQLVALPARVLSSCDHAPTPRLSSLSSQSWNLLLMVSFVFQAARHHSFPERTLPAVSDAHVNPTRIRSISGGKLKSPFRRRHSVLCDFEIFRIRRKQKRAKHWAQSRLGLFRKLFRLLQSSTMYQMHVSRALLDRTYKI